MKPTIVEPTAGRTEEDEMSTSVSATSITDHELAHPAGTARHTGARQGRKQQSSADTSADAGPRHEPQLP
jgi:hypothetical protein